MSRCPYFTVGGTTALILGTICGTGGIAAPPEKSQLLSNKIVPLQKSKVGKFCVNAL
jgi:hypothetical protein